jgi:PilZ domain
MQENERRVAHRFNMQLQASMVNLGSGSRYQSQTRDISCDGAYFNTEKPLPLGTRLAVSVELHSTDHYSGRRSACSWVDVAGTVIRRDTKGMVVLFNSRYRIHQGNG